MYERNSKKGKKGLPTGQASRKVKYRIEIEMQLNLRTFPIACTIVPPTERKAKGKSRTSLSKSLGRRPN